MQSIQFLVTAITFAVAAATGSSAIAQATTDHGKAGHMQMAAGAAGEMSDAEVRKVDTEQGKVTLKHGPIKSLDMPGMTMVFTVSNKALLDGVKAGDQVKFTAANLNGRMTVTQLMLAK